MTTRVSSVRTVFVVIDIFYCTLRYSRKPSNPVLLGSNSNIKTSLVKTRPYQSYLYLLPIWVFISSDSDAVSFYTFDGMFMTQ